jgi:hypothetical protein
MKAEDLRIGNLVMDNAKVKIVTSGMISNWDIIKRDYGGYKPIPLTEEWLVRFGFEYIDYYNNYRIIAGDYHNSVQLRDGEWLYNGDISDAECYGIREIKYVHTLQNLYHALNDEELTLNETI